MGLIARRYAQALALTAEEGNRLESFRNQLGQAAAVLAENETAKNFLENPNIARKDKKELIRTVFQGKLDDVLTDFLILLVEKNRIGLLQEIAAEYSLLADKKLNVLRIKLISAEPLTQEQAERLKEKYMAQYAASSVTAELEVDKNLIGGIKVIIGDTVIDGSLKGRLEGLKNILFGKI